MTSSWYHSKNSTSPYIKKRLQHKLLTKFVYDSLNASKKGKTKLRETGLHA